MNPIRTATGLIQLPAHAAAVVVRTAVRVVGWGFERLTGPSAPPARSPWSSASGPVAVDLPEVAEPVEPVEPVVSVPTAPVKKAPAKKAPVKKAPAKKAPAKRARAKKTPAKKASSKQAAVLAPGLGLSEAEVEDKIIDQD